MTLSRPDRTLDENRRFYDALADLMDAAAALRKGRPVPVAVVGRLLCQPPAVQQAVADVLARQVDAEGYGVDR